LTVHDRGFETTSREGPREDQLARVLRYVDEAAGAGKATVEQADVNVVVQPVLVGAAELGVVLEFYREICDFQVLGDDIRARSH
jgi:hypothetical protein